MPERRPLNFVWPSSPLTMARTCRPTSSLARRKKLSESTNSSLEGVLAFSHARVCVDTLMHHPCVQFLHAPTRIVSWWTWVDPHSVTPRLRLLQYNTHLWGPSLFNSLPRVEFSTIITFLSKRAPRRILPVPRPEQ